MVASVAGDSEIRSEPATRQSEFPNRHTSRNGESLMPSRSFLRAMLTGAGVVLAILLAIMAVRHFGRDEPSQNAFDPAEFVRSRPKLDAPYVATDYEVVDAMLAMAEVRPDDYVIDLGSGDGRILIAAARSHGANGLGVDIDPDRIRESTLNAQAAGVAHRVRF